MNTNELTADVVKEYQTVDFLYPTIEDYAKSEIINYKRVIRNNLIENEIVILGAAKLIADCIDTDTKKAADIAAVSKNSINLNNNVISSIFEKLEVLEKIAANGVQE